MNQDRRNWHSTDGILRKKDETDHELLVFGYSCKLFKDDEKALVIDQGKHLIPWMGDETLKIDRYDVRGAISDLSKYEASNIDTGMAWDALSSDERKVELMCDEERYRALFHNEDEEALYQEEELKRLHQALGSDKEYGQVAYQYEDKQTESSGNLMEEEAASDDQQEPFIPPPQLDIPPNMTIPETKKQNAIIEKTAMFINQQGPQMEILLKMKQASNPQFEFLSISNPLHSYYRHVLAVIKTGRYKPTLSNSDKNNRHSDYEEHYLHPSLLPTPSTLELAPSIPSISYRPSADCTYSMLVNRIKSKQEGTVIISSSIPVVVPEEESPKEIFGAAVKYTSNKDANTIDPENFSNHGVRMVSKSTKRRRRRRLYPSSNGQQSPLSGQTLNLYNTQGNLSSHLGLSVNSLLPVEEPPPELKVIIDKMASYVIKNGRDFEAIVRNKGDPRFSFLNSGSQYHAYYERQVNYLEALNKPSTTVVPTNLLSPMYTIDNNDSCSEEEEIVVSQGTITTLSTISTLSSESSDFPADKPASNPVDRQSKGTRSKDLSERENHSTNKPVPVCFSIKKPKEVDKLELPSALPVEESSNEEDERDEDSSPDKQHNPPKVEEKKLKQTTSMDKWAEERVKDKLAQAAKEKLAMKEKEKQLQLERRKRALAFLNLLQKDNLEKKNYEELREDSESRAPSIPSSVTSLSSGNSSENEDNSHNICPNNETSLNASDKAQASQTLQRILDAVPKDRYNREKKSHRSSPSHSHSYSKSRSEYSSKHHHHKSHKRHHNSREKESYRRSSHKRKHKSKSSKSHKRRRKSGSVCSLSSD